MLCLSENKRIDVLSHRHTTPQLPLYYLDKSVHHHAADDLCLVGLLFLPPLSVTDNCGHI